MKKVSVQKDLPLGLYLHMDAYCRALERHLAEVAPQAACHLVDTVYFGGGTPSYLGADRL